jgi:tol-pal system protein YbgF
MKLLFVLTVGIALCAGGISHAEPEDTAGDGDDARSQPQPQPLTAENMLQQRIAALERQITEMRAMIAALQSMYRQDGVGERNYPSTLSPAYPPGPSSNAADMAERMSIVEMQIEAISKQISAANITALPPPDIPQNRAGFSDYGNGVAEQAIGENEVISDDTVPLDADTPDEASIALSPEELYNQAYSHFINRDYERAEADLSAFLAGNSQGSLAGNAQFWLGETFFLRGRYKEAANAFLKGYRLYKNSSKGPDILLRLGMSLQRMEQSRAACGAFGELQRIFPNASQHVKQHADAERRKAGCL